MRWPKIRRRYKSILAVGTVLTVLAWLAASTAVAYRLTHRHRPVIVEPVPAVAWAEFEPIRLRTRDGYNLGAWFAPGSSTTAPSVLLLHGNGGGRGDCLDLAEVLAAEGCGVLLVTLRAHGDSSGSTFDFGYSDRADVVAGAEYLESRRPGRPLIIAGRSLGSAAAVFASAELSERVHGYLLECPYRDLRTAVRKRTQAYLPWPLDGLAYAGLLTVAPLFVEDINRIAPVEAIRGIPDSIPVLILAGGEDHLADPSEAESLHDRIQTHGRLIIFEGAGHLGLFQADPARYKRELLKLLREAAGGVW